MSKEKARSNEKDDNLEGDVGLTTIPEKSSSAQSSSNAIFTLDEDTVWANSKIFGLKNPSANLTQWQKVVNENAFELAKRDSNLLYNRGLLKAKAEERARASYIFKKKTGSRSANVLHGTEPEPKRQKLSKGDRAHEIHTVSTEIDMIKKHIIIKQQMIRKATSVKDFHLCDNEQKEMRELVKKELKLEKPLKELQKKETKGKWYEKTKKKNANISANCSSSVVSKKPLPPKSAANTRDIRTLFALKPCSSTANKGTHNAENEVDGSHTEGEMKSGEKEAKIYDDEIEMKENQPSDGMKSGKEEVKDDEIEVIENQASDAMKSGDKETKANEIHVRENQASDGRKSGKQEVKDDEIQVIVNQANDGMKSGEEVKDDEIQVIVNQTSDGMKSGEEVKDDEIQVIVNQASDGMKSDEEEVKDDEIQVIVN